MWFRDDRSRRQYSPARQEFHRTGHNHRQVCLFLIKNKLVSDRSKNIQFKKPKGSSN